MDNSPTIYDALKNDHQTVKGLLDQLVQFSEEGNDDWKEIVTKIRDELIPHSRAEEALFYNAIRELNPDQDVVGHSYAEHAMAEAELRTLQAMTAIDVNWKKLANKLRDDLLHHVSEEETRVFAEARKVFSDEEAQMVAKAFIELKPSIREESFMGTSMDFVENLLPRRLVSGFKKGWQSITHPGQSSH